MQTLEYISELKNFFRTQANPTNALFMEKYMRYQFPFLGIKTPERKALLRQFLKEHPLDEGQVAEIARGLWHLPEREFHYVAMDLLINAKAKKKEWHQDDLDLLETLIVDKSWWDTVDVLAPRLVGPYVLHFPQAGREALDRWIESDNIWLRRSCLIHQLRFKEQTDEKLLFDYILKCKDSQEFFIQKAIGWALREYAKTNPQAVLDFVDRADLPPLSRREALKHFIREGAKR